MQAQKATASTRLRTRRWQPSVGIETVSFNSARPLPLHPLTLPLNRGPTLGSCRHSSSYRCRRCVRRRHRRRHPMSLPTWSPIRSDDPLAPEPILPPELAPPLVLDDPELPEDPAPLPVPEPVIEPAPDGELDAAPPPFHRLLRPRFFRQTRHRSLRRRLRIPPNTRLRPGKPTSRQNSSWTVSMRKKVRVGKRSTERARRARSVRTSALRCVPLSRASAA
jgi:hypothetical protein